MTNDTRHGISFDRVTNAIDDLGWDPDGNDPINIPTDDGLLIDVPPGEYEFRGTGGSGGPVEGSLQRWGLRGIGDAPEDVRFRSDGPSTCFVNSAFSSRDILLENVTFDNGSDRAGGDIGNTLRCQDGLEVHDVHHIGFSGAEPFCRYSILPLIASPEGVGNIVNYRKTGPSLFIGHGGSDGAGGVFEKHEGTLFWSGGAIANQGGDGGLYTGKHPGRILFDGVTFRNNDLAVIRTGAGCELRDCTLVMDWENAHSQNLVADDLPEDLQQHYNAARNVLDEPADHEKRIENNSPTGTSGLYLSSAQFGKSGGGLYDCDIVLLSTYERGLAAICVNNSDGRIDIHDCSIRVDVDDMAALWCRDAANQRFSSHETPDEPWGPNIRDLRITGSGTGHHGNGDGGRPVGSMICLHNRHETTIDRLDIDAPNASLGVDVETCRGAQIGATDISVGGGEAIRGAYGALTDGGTNGDELTGDSTMAEHTLTITGPGRGTGEHEYEATVRGTWTGGDFERETDASPVDNGDGTVSLPPMSVWGDGRDTYSFEGDLVEFQFQTKEDASRVTLDGEALSVPYTRGEGGGVDQNPTDPTDPSTSEPPTEDTPPTTDESAVSRAEFEALRERVDGNDGTLIVYGERLTAVESELEAMASKPPLRERIKMALFGSE